MHGLEALQLEPYLDLQSRQGTVPTSKMSAKPSTLNLKILFYILGTQAVVEGMLQGFRSWVLVFIWF